MLRVGNYTMSDCRHGIHPFKPQEKFAYSEMSFAVPGVADAEVLQIQLQALCLANAKWYVSEWEAGRDPSCCADCAGVLWKEPPRRFTAEYAGAPHILARTDGPGGKPTAGCAEIVCMNAGAEIAKLYRDHGVPLAGGLWSYHAIVEPVGPGMFHAKMMTPVGLKDPAAEMERA